MLQNERSLEMTRQQHQTEYVVRCLFERVGDASFVGHLDLMHTFDRAIRRAEMPILYTQGYNPRPMMVFALPLGVGIDTLGDYVDISLSRVVDAEESVAVFAVPIGDILPLLAFHLVMVLNDIACDAECLLPVLPSVEELMFSCPQGIAHCRHVQGRVDAYSHKSPHLLCIHAAHAGSHYDVGLFLLAELLQIG